MVSSGTFLFDPSVADMVVHAYLHCQVKRSQLTPEHMIDARMCANLLLAEWENVQPKLWTVEMHSELLVQGTPTYVMPPQLILPLDVYISTTIGGQVNDRICYPVSRSDYVAYPNKLQEGAPSVYWCNRQIIPEISFYLTPDGNGPYTAKVWHVRQIEDANATAAETLDLARRFQPAFLYGLAARLANIYQPSRFDSLEMAHQRLLTQATSQDQENADIQLSPILSSYFR